MELDQYMLNKQLRAACKRGHIRKVLKLELLGADIRYANHKGFTCLHIAAKKGHSGVTRVLMYPNDKLEMSLKGEELSSKIQKLYLTLDEEDEKDDEFIFQKEEQKLDDEEFIKTKKERADTDRSIDHGFLDFQDKKGKTALHHACEKGNVTCVNVLLAERANHSVLDKDKRTPLFYAAKNGNEEIVKLLIDQGANTKITDINGVTIWDFTKKENIKMLLLEN